MRIISGKFKGRRIFPPKNLPVRPTTDMSKEALFNVLNNHFSFDSLKVLDLFSGTGNISYEFASRGSENITSVDGDFGCVKFIKQVAEEYDFNIAAIKSDISIKDILKVIPRIKSVNGRFEKIGKIKNNSKVILDYAHTPEALSNCLQNLEQQYKNRKIAITAIENPLSKELITII